MNRPLRILVAHNVACQHPGGVSRIMRFIHDQLVEAGHDIDYLCSEDVPASFRGRWGRFTFPWAVLGRVRAARRAGKPYDIVNVHEVNGAVIAALRRTTYPLVVVTSHGLERRAWEFAKEEARLGRQGPGLKTRISVPLTLLWQSDLALRHADHIFCLNADDREYLVRQFGFPGSRITRITPGAATVYSARAAGRDYSSGNRILFAATWRKNKGIEDIVPAFSELASRYTDLRLTVLGSGLPVEKVMFAFPENVRGRIRCVQTRSEIETADQFASSDLFLLPSLFEGTPLTLIEAMMSGLPIVTTATCGMKDIIQNGENGLLVPIRSPSATVAAIERLVIDRELRARLGMSARGRALQHYTWPMVARPIAEAYEQLAAEAAL